MEILELINKKFGNKYDFLRVLKVEFNTLLSCAEIWFLYPENVPDLTFSDKKEITTFLDEILDLSVKPTYKFKRSFLDEEIIKKAYIDFLKNTYPSIFSYDVSRYIYVEKNQENIIINFEINSITNTYFLSNNVIENSIKYMQKIFIALFNINIKINDEIKLDTEIIIEREKEYYSSIPAPQKTERYEVFEPVKIFGDDITPMPELIKNQTGEKLSVILSGRVSNFKEGTYISKKNKQKEIQEQSFYYSFTITDHTGKLPVIYFSSKTNLEKIRRIKDGDSILVIGNIKKGFRDLTLHIKSLSLCEIVVPEKEEIKEVQKFELSSPTHIENYKTIFPRQYECATQSNLFDIPKQYNQEFLNTNYVVFDVETTGLNPEFCEIIEIGSVKIQNGKITETFNTLIKPNHEISDEITNLTHITNEMVQNSPQGKDVVHDFYKFCEGCTIVGYNVAFDHAFLQNLAKSVGLSFPNPVLDAMAVTKQKLYLPKYKLINVVEALGLELNNAHRAYADALATAQVLQKLNEIK